MTKILVDTSALIAFFIKSEKHHTTVREYCSANSNAQWVILSTVFDETVTWLRIKVSIQASIEIGEILREVHHYIALSELDDLATWEVFSRYDDKFWSYTDCSLLAMANRLEISNILSFDRHFRQMSGLGIVCFP